MTLPAGSMKFKTPPKGLTPKTFAAGLFGDAHWEDQLYVAMPRNPDDTSNLIFPHEADPDVATHYCQSWFEPTEDGKANRRKENWGGLCMVVLDDVGEKADVPGCLPTAIVETKPGSQQWVYVFDEPIEDPDLADLILASLERAGSGDTNTLRRNQVFRLPGSLPPGKQHPAEVLHWAPDRTFAGNAGFLSKLEVEPFEDYKVQSFQRRSILPGLRVHDPVADWLHESGHVRGEEASWLVIDCPWGHEHTDDRDVAKYNPATADDQMRTFHCHHSHGHDTEDFLDWVCEQGGPDVARDYEIPFEDYRQAAMSKLGPALEQLGAVWDAPSASKQRDEVTQRVTDYMFEEDWDKYLCERYVAVGNLRPYVVDLERLASDETRQFRLSREALKWEYAPQAIPQEPGPRGGRPQPLNPVDIWNGSPNRVTVRGETWNPEHGVGDVSEGLLNTCALPVHDPEPRGRTKAAKLWRALIAHVFPQEDERRYFEDWLAYKVQNPASRAPAVVSVAPMTGTGRGTLIEVMSQLFGVQNVTRVGAGRLLGLTSQSQYNDYLAESLLVTCDEIQSAEVEGKHYSSRNKAAEHLKELVDPAAASLRLTVKGGSDRVGRVYANFFLCTNRPDALLVENEDRRLAIMSGNDVPLPNTLAHDVWSDLVGNPEAIACLWHQLSHHDTGAYDPAARPPWTRGKAIMQDAGRSAFDDAIADIMGLLPRPIICGQLIMEGLRKARLLDSLGLSESHARMMVQGWLKAQGYRPVVTDDGVSARLRVPGASWGSRLSVRGFVTSDIVGTLEQKIARDWLQENDAAIPAAMARLSSAMEADADGVQKVVSLQKAMRARSEKEGEK